MFTRTLPTETWAKVGELIVSVEEWPSIKRTLAATRNFIIEQDS